METWIPFDTIFTSVEQQDNPKFSDLLVVLGLRPGDFGRVAAAGYQAQHFGIHSAVMKDSSSFLSPNRLSLLRARECTVNYHLRSIKSIDTGTNAIDGFR